MHFFDTLSDPFHALEVRTSYGLSHLDVQEIPHELRLRTNFTHLAPHSIMMNGSGTEFRSELLASNPSITDIVNFPDETTMLGGSAKCCFRPILTAPDEDSFRVASFETLRALVRGGLTRCSGPDEVRESGYTNVFAVNETMWQGYLTSPYAVK